jgi:bla regulator protein BlaR1
MRKWKLRNAPLVGVTGMAGSAAIMVLSLSVALVQAQTTAAGGKPSFEVASVKPGNPETFTPPNFPLDYLDTFGAANPHGRFVAEFPLEIYVAFAYKLLPRSQEQKNAMLAHVPRWVSTDKYAINAEAKGDPTKDQIRLMMQSLLADRFKLAVHFERQEVPVLALVLDKPGKTGAKLYPHSNGPACDVPSTVFPIVCDQLLAIGRPNNAVMMGSRNMTMGQIAAGLIATGEVTRPVVDQTGLDGRFDFTLEWTREPKNPVPAPEVQPDLPATTLQQALQDQLGLKVKSTKVFMDTLVIDHVERPSEN